jgi:hypothetical protein
MHNHILKIFQTKRTNNIISTFQKAGLLLKSISLTLALTLLAHQISPTILMAQEGTYQEIEQQEQLDNDKTISTTIARLSQTHEKYKKLKQRDDDTSKEEQNKAIEKISTLLNDFDKNNIMILQEFEAQKELITSKNLSATILDRHEKMVQHYIANRDQLKHDVQQTIKEHNYTFVEKAKQSVVRTYRRAYRAVTNTTEQDELNITTSPLKNVDTKKFTRYQQAFDPEALPSNNIQPNKNNKPKLTKEAFDITSSLNVTPLAEVAALGSFDYSKLDDADNSAYLQESDEIVFTQDIKDKAKALNYNSAEIYNWVKQNVKWIPTWGAVQNASLTLSARQGNAMDIASLTIALLRASEIPSRYVHGTIEVEPQKFMNWAGGVGGNTFTDIYAAGNYASSGGIPTAVVIAAGTVSQIQMEHVWVEVVADYYPSRGVKNIVADTWVPLDPSFKQYEYVEGIKKDKLTQIAGIDVEQLAQDIINSAEINGSSISNIDTTAITQALEASQDKIRDYVENNLTTELLDNNQTTNTASTTLIDIIGGSKIIKSNRHTLPYFLENSVVVEGKKYDKLPSDLKQYVTYSFNTISFGLTGSEYKIKLPYSTVNNEKVSFSFKPATQEDEETLLSLLPDSNSTDANSTSNSTLPDSIPAGLINLTAELKVNGEVVKSGLNVGLGDEVQLSTTIKLADGNVLKKRSHIIPAGSLVSLNTVAGSISVPAYKLKILQEKLKRIQNTLSSNNFYQLSTLDNDSLIGDLMYTGTLSYYAQLKSYQQTRDFSQKTFSTLIAGQGIFSYQPKVSYLFGIPQKIGAGAINLDIPMSEISAISDNNQTKLKNFQRSDMYASALEHIVPEQMFSTPEYQVDGFSTVKAFQKANAQGQKLFLITQENQEEILQQLNHSSQTMNAITKALNAGQEVTIHESPVSVQGYTGSGYRIFDPVTGNRADMISGGDNGGRTKVKVQGPFIIAVIASTLNIFLRIYPCDPVAAGIISYVFFQIFFVARYALIAFGVIGWFLTAALIAVGAVMNALADYVLEQNDCG